MAADAIVVPIAHTAPSPHAPLALIPEQSPTIAAPHGCTDDGYADSDTTSRWIARNDDNLYL